MLELNPEIIYNIIDKAREFHAKEDVEPPEDNAEDADTAVGYDFYQVLSTHRDDPTLNEFINLINDLDPDQQEELIALMYIGRGDYSIEEFSEAKKQARTIPNENRAEYLLSKPLLAEYLADGLTQINQSSAE